MDYASLLISLAGGLAGQAASQGDRDAARKAIEKLLANYNGIQTPTLNDVAPDTVGPSALGQIGEDPNAAQGFQEGQAALKSISDGGGLDLGDKAALAGVDNQLSRQDSASRNALTEQFARRGQLGAGAQLAAGLQNASASADRASQAGEQVAGDARRRALQAIMQRSQNAQSYGNEQYRRQSQAAQAADAITAHNASARRNAGIYGNNLAQSNFANQMNLANGKAGVGGTAANWYGNEANRVQRLGAQTGQALGQAFSTLGDDDEKKVTRPGITYDPYGGSY